MKIRIILSGVTAAAMALTLTACSGDTTPQNPLDIINSGITSSSAISSGSYSSSSENTSSSMSTTSEPQIDVDSITEALASDFEYEYKKELGGVVITKYIGDKFSVKIPSFIEGVKVVSVGERAFYCLVDIAAVVVIPDGVNTIGEKAFSGCSGLTGVVIPNSVTEIGKNAFGGCKKLTSMTLPNNLTIINEEAFYNCNGISKITIPNGVKETKYGAFERCTGLTSITIPNGVTEIGGYYNNRGGFASGAFKDCTGLTSITIPDSVTTIYREAFSGCTANITYKGKAYTSDDYDELYKAINSN